MQRFLAANEPWASLFRDGHLVWSTMAAGEAVEPVAGLRVVAHGLPHRADFTDTVAFEIEAAATVLYAPDIDRWQEWPDAYEVIDRCDVALVDGTFFSDDELAHRDQAEVPHPAVVETIEVFRELATTTRIVLTHLNHTNPLCDPNAAEHQVVQEAGFEVAHDGMEVPL
jgi:pyrroloquinoline quinone biosynthesis protein B